MTKQGYCRPCEEWEKQVLVDGQRRRQAEYRKSCSQPTQGCNVCGVHVCKKCWSGYQHDMQSAPGVRFDKR